MSARVIAVVGAESTGKTTLVRSLGDTLRLRGLDVAEVPEALRDFCDQHGRTPRVHEQSGIAAEQSRRVSRAAAEHELVLADTTALMVAVYSDYIFNDGSLYRQAEQDHSQATLTLLTALDLPWVSDDFVRDGPHVREPVDSLIRQALARLQAPYAVIQGEGARRLEQALMVVEHTLDASRRAARLSTGGPRWRWVCERCDDGGCERGSLQS